MFGNFNVNLLVLGTLLSPALAATLKTLTTSLEVSDTRITGTGGVFNVGEQVTGEGIDTGGMIVAATDNTLVNDIRNAWRNAQGSSSGIYYELQECSLVLYPGQSKPWPADTYFAVYLPPMSVP